MSFQWTIVKTANSGVSRLIDFSCLFFQPRCFTMLSLFCFKLMDSCRGQLSDVLFDFLSLFTRQLPVMIHVKPFLQSLSFEARTFSVRLMRTTQQFGCMMYLCRNGSHITR